MTATPIRPLPQLIAHADGVGAWWATWNADLTTHLALVALAGVYTLGVGRLWSRAGAGRGIARAQVLAFTAGLAALVAALVSPIDVLSDELQWMHMVQHMLIMMVAAPLIVLGGAAVAGVWALPARWRGPVVDRLTRRRAAAPLPLYLLWHPLLVWTLLAVVLWVWHAPALYEAALRNRVVHDAQHIGFFVAAALFWRALLDPFGRLRRTSPVLGVLLLFGTSLHAMLLGVFMTLAPAAWYAPYEGRTAAWGLSALEDQQVAGSIMWMPMGMLIAAAATGLLALWLRRVGETNLDPGLSAAVPRPRSS